MSTATDIRILNEASQRSTDDVLEKFKQKVLQNQKFYNEAFYYGGRYKIDEMNHPWKYNLRTMAKMLEGEVKITHGKTETREEEPLGIIWVSECQDCCNAFELRLKYLNKKHGSPILITVQLIK